MLNLAEDIVPRKKVSSRKKNDKKHNNVNNWTDEDRAEIEHFFAAYLKKHVVPSLRAIKGGIFKSKKVNGRLGKRTVESVRSYLRRYLQMSSNE